MFLVFSHFWRHNGDKEIHKIKNGVCRVLSNEYYLVFHNGDFNKNDYLWTYWMDPSYRLAEYLYASQRDLLFDSTNHSAHNKYFRFKSKFLYRHHYLLYVFICIYSAFRIYKIETIYQQPRCAGHVDWRICEVNVGHPS